MKKFPICVDFDGTMVAHRYPMIGSENKPCVEVLKKWVDAGVGIILDTMRSDKELEEALAWCKERGIEIYGVNKCPNQETWTKSTKAWGYFSIDDRNLGCPLKQVDGERPMVDWGKIDAIFSPMIIQFAKEGI